MQHQMLTVSSPPHINGKDTTTRRMRDVLIALAPALLLGIYYYGIPGLMITALAIIAAVFAEALYQKVTGQKVTINDLSAVLTGLLLAFNLPPAVPFWIPILGSFFAIIVVKQLFGGLGSNFINPALGARAFLLASFPVHMTNWTFAPDSVASATYLALMRNPLFAPEHADYMAVLFGKIGGSFGETSAVALIIGGIYMMIRRVINWRIPVFFIGSFALFAFVFGRHGGFFSGEHLLFELLSGGLMLGAFFMATDYATSPITPNGKIVFAIGCGFLAVMIRFYSGYPEGVCYAILIMNIFVPIIDKYTRPRIYGRRKKA
ncbi:MAG: RnfABCDGE type electron transport complex subunit D [Clostridiales bacterium]|nr:RnfABCDGE type electron transport complex subunit D [Clostridiales bacterium]